MKLANLQNFAAFNNCESELGAQNCIGHYNDNIYGLFC